MAPCSVSWMVELRDISKCKLNSYFPSYPMKSADNAYRLALDI